MRPAPGRRRRARPRAIVNPFGSSDPFPTNTRVEREARATFDRVLPVARSFGFPRDPPNRPTRASPESCRTGSPTVPCSDDSPSTHPHRTCGSRRKSQVTEATPEANNTRQREAAALWTETKRFASPCRTPRQDLCSHSYLEDGARVRRRIRHISPTRPCTSERSGKGSPRYFRWSCGTTFRAARPSSCRRKKMARTPSLSHMKDGKGSVTSSRKTPRFLSSFLNSAFALMIDSINPFLPVKLVVPLSPHDTYRLNRSVSTTSAHSSRASCFSSIFLARMSA